MKLAELAEKIGARLLGDGGLEVTHVAHVEEAGAGDLAFAASAHERRAAYTTQAVAVLVDDGFAAEHAHELPCAVLAADPVSRALVTAVELLHAERAERDVRKGRAAPAVEAGVHERAVVDAAAKIDATAFVGALAVIGRAKIGAGARVMPLAYVGDDVVLGANVIVGVGAVVLEGTRVGARTIIGPGTVIGDSGFVFAPRGDENVALRHLAHVTIGDDVDIGANSAIDRGALRDTRVMSGARVDNLVQVGHDVHVGENAVIVAQVGIAGDAQIGAGAILTGQVGVQEHTRIGERARIGGRAGVTRDVEANAAVSGLPAVPHAEWLRSAAALRRLPALEKRVRHLERTTGVEKPRDD